MTALISIFATSLLLIAAFFALKEWEFTHARETRLTSALKERSPHAEALSMRFVRVLERIAHLILQTVRDAAVRVFVRSARVFQHGTVVVAAHMIRATRGEHLVVNGRVPSTFFKHLTSHKRHITGDAIPEGIAHPDAFHRVSVHVEDTASGDVSQTQIE
jgi:hypothetical protein